MIDRQRLTSGSASEEAGPLLRSRLAKLVLGILAVVLILGFVSLGTWQVVRLQWKLALIERVEQRAHAPAVSAPAEDRWSQISAGSDEYRHVSVSGHFLHQDAALTQATTELGAGYWLLTPLREADGNIVLINRGFVTAQGAAKIRAATSAENMTEAGTTARADSQQQVSGEAVTINGLLRISEPAGGFLRKNDPATDRWHSRDVEAIAASRQLTRVAPYFIDADANSNAGGSSVQDVDAQPVGGLTVISFANNHLVYALTWYALALMVIGIVFWMVRTERKRRVTSHTASHID